MRSLSLPTTQVPLGGDGCELFAASLTSSLDTLVRRGFLGTGGAAGWPTAHRACVFDFDAGKCLAVVSHTDLMRWLHPRLVAPGGPCAALGAATLTALGLSPKPRVYMVTPDEPAINAFAALLERGLPAAGVAGGAGDRAVIGALSLSDLKGLAPDKLASLALPVGEFLALAHQAVWSSAPSGPRRFGGGAAAADSTGGASAGGAASPPPTPPGGGLSHRDRLLQRHTLASLPPSASLAAAVEMLGAGRARAVFVVDQDSAPLAVVTPTDVLRLLAGGGQ